MSRTEFSVGPVSLQAVVDRTLKALEPTIESSNASIEVQRDLPDVVGFSLILERAASNLLNNALKYKMPNTSPKVYIGAEQSQQTVRWFFQDNGIGIEKAYQTKIFEPFERLHGSESYSGTGFGLAIVQRGINRLGGRCGVESELGKGSCFWIELPAAKPEESA